VDSQEVNRYFTEAGEYFHEGQYQEALTRLVKLNEARPNSREVIYGIARCYARLNMPKQAREAAEYLKQQFDDPRADKLIEQLQEAPTVALTPMEDVAVTPPPRQPKPKSGRSLPEFNWQYALIGVVVLAVVGFFALPLLSSGDGTPPPAPAPATSSGGPATDGGPQVPFAMNTGMLTAITLVLQLVVGLPLFYLVLSIMGKHPGEGLENWQQAGLCWLIMCLLGLIPFIGWILGYFVLARFYDMSIFEIIIFIVINLVIGLAIGTLVAVMVGGAILANMPSLLAVPALAR